ncbi:MAG: adenylate/guanylate cyclase with repeat [Actinomycetia bacterium]|nr:adenylate/guanylate cyclase with repeat [Actinomycetes bacterium]
MTCPVCGTVAVPGARFCHHCGAALPDAVTMPGTERRVVTVLFGDLSDFTAWSEDLDPERVGSVTDRVLAACAQAVTAFGGHVDKLTGDGIMAVFGAPVAHEDDPERAVRAALAMQRAVKRLIDDEVGGGRQLGLRVGLNTGPVVAGVQAAVSYTVIGDTVNTAARLSDSAVVGGVLAGERTARATRDRAAWRALPPLRLKGKREPVASFELLGLRDAPGIRPGLGDEASFVGREAELGRILGRFAETAERRVPHVLVVTAEAGAGKTRLAAEASRGIGGELGSRVLSVRCRPYGEGRRWGPLADVVRQAIGVEPDDDSDRVAAKVRRVAARLGHQPETDLAPAALEALFELLGIATEPESPLGGLSAPGTWHASRLPMTVSELLSGLAAEDPVLLVVDDLHNATPEAVDAFGVLVAQLTGPVLVLLLGRPELVRQAGVLTRLPDAEALPLPPLSGAAAGRLLRSYLGGGRLPQGEENQLLATAQGNPFYLAELVSLLVEQGRLTGGSAGWRLAGLTGRLLSSDLAAVLAARIDTLPAHVRAVLRDAAVIGDRIPVGSLEALRGTTGTAAEDLDRALKELVSRRMLRRRTSRGGYAFATTLMREAAYSGIGKADLAERHARVARWLDGTHPRGLTDAERDELIVTQVERATSLAQAMLLPENSDARRVAQLGADALGRLAEAALAAGDPSRAIALLDRAAELAPGALSPPRRLIRARALLQTGRAAEAVPLASSLVEPDAGQVELPVRLGALLALGEAHRELGQSRAAVASWNSAARESRREGLPRFEAEALRRLGMHDYLDGRLRSAENRFFQSYQRAVEARDNSGQGWALQNLAWSATSRGDFRAAEDALHRAGALFGELGDPAGQSWVSGTEAFVGLLQGRLGMARRLANDFMPFGERAGDTWGVAALRTVEAFAAAELGELTHAERQARRALAGFETSTDAWGRSLALTVRALVARGAGRPEAAIPLLDEAERVATQAVHPLTAGIARTLRGYCRVDAGDYAGAEQDARATLDLLAPLEVEEPARVGPIALLAEARRGQGHLAEAVSLLADVAESGSAALVFPRRQVLALYASALLDAGQDADAVEWARRAQQVPAEDLRSQIVAKRVLALALARTGDREGAAVAAKDAVQLAYATEQVAERAVSDAVLATIG